MKFALVFLSCLIYQVWSEEGRICWQPSDCGPGECCILPSSRFVNASCHALVASGGQCRPNSQPEDYSFAVRPDSSDRVHVTGGYRNICPCAQELECKAGTCQ